MNGLFPLAQSVSPVKGRALWALTFCVQMDPPVSKAAEPSRAARPVALPWSQLILWPLTPLSPLLLSLWGEGMGRVRAAPGLHVSVTPPGPWSLPGTCPWLLRV